MRQSCVHERPAFEFLSALVTVRCGGVCWISLPLVSITYFKLLSLKARLPNRRRDMRLLVNWQPCLPSVCFPDAKPPKKGVSSPSDMYFFLFPLTKTLSLWAMIQSMRQPCNILKGKTSRAHVIHISRVFCGWLIAPEWGQCSSTALLMSSYKDVCYPFSLPPPPTTTTKAGYSGKCAALSREGI